MGECSEYAFHRLQKSSFFCSACPSAPREGQAGVDIRHNTLPTICCLVAHEANSRERGWNFHQSMFGQVLVRLAVMEVLHPLASGLQFLDIGLVVGFNKDFWEIICLYGTCIGMVRLITIFSSVPLMQLFLLRSL